MKTPGIESILVSVLIVLITAVLPLSGQDWQVQKIEKLTDAGDGRYFYPQFSPDGSTIIFTKEKYRGLYSLDLQSRRLSVLTDAPGAGYQPAIRTDGKKIYFRKQTVVKRRIQSSLVELDTGTGLEIDLVPAQHHVTPPQLINGQQLVYRNAGGLQSLDLQPSALKKSAGLPAGSFVYTENRSITLYQNGKKKGIQPLGEGHYIWASLSPDNQQIMFTLAGKGTYISTLEGKILHELGTARAPRWSPDGQWIVSMVDKDDGYRYTASELFITSLDGSRKIQLTGGELIAMFPAWSPDGRNITFHSLAGEIYLLHLQHVENVKQ
jgi:Tol biopolymer transport system component